MYHNPWLQLVQNMRKNITGYYRVVSSKPCKSTINVTVEQDCSIMFQHIAVRYGKKIKCVYGKNFN